MASLANNMYTINDMMTAIRFKLAGEPVYYTDILTCFNEAIDDINNDFGANFPEFLDNYSYYTYMPRKYVRSVLIPLVCAKYFEADEEGIQNATGYVEQYNRGMNFMKRDFLAEFHTAQDDEGNYIYEPYWENSNYDYFEQQYTADNDVRGLSIDGGVFKL